MSFEKIDFHDGDSWTVFDKNKSVSRERFTKQEKVSQKEIR